MRNLLLITVVLSHVSFAQSWCPPEARWIYDTGHPWGYVSAMQVSCGGDTILDGYEATKMMISTVTTQLIGIDTLITGTGLGSVTREQNDVVFQWDPNASTWDTLFWFSAVPGDHWIPILAFAQCDPHLEFHVVDTSTVSMGGLQLRQLEVQPYYEGEMHGGVVLIRERVGYLYGFYYYIPFYCGGVFECYCAFTCYADSQMSYPGSGPCELTLGVEMNYAPSQFEIFPNPGQDSFLVRCSEAVQSQIHIRDPLGRLLMGPFSFRDDIHVDTSELPPGTYLIELQMPSSSVVERWIKQ